MIDLIQVGKIFPERTSRRVLHHNRPGQPKVSYCLGTHTEFLQRMLERLRYHQTLDGQKEDSRPLRLISINPSDELAIAFLDAWSVVADVIAFYQERLANEGFLRTATERRSIRELARTVGYELKPGLSACTHLAFTVEDAPGAPREVEVPASTKVQSIPEPGRMPQIFETKDQILARPKWNRLSPEMTRTAMQNGSEGTTKLLLKVAVNQLQPGDVILIVGEDRETDPKSKAWDLRVLKTVASRPDIGAIEVTWQKPLKSLKRPKIFAFGIRASLFGSNAPDWRHLPEDVKQRYVFHKNKSGNDWPNLDSRAIEGKEVIDLDSEYKGIIEDSWVVFTGSNVEPALYRAEEVTAVFRSDFMLNSRVTRIRPDAEQNISNFPVRETTVLAQSETLALAELPVKWMIEGKRLELDRLVHGLKSNMLLIVSGKRMSALVTKNGLDFRSGDVKKKVLARGELMVVLKPPEKAFESKEGLLRWTLMDSSGFLGTVDCPPDFITLENSGEEDEEVGEVVRLKDVTHSNGRTTLIFSEALKNCYDPNTVRVYANVVGADHGETVHEVLGSGDGTQINQRFDLKNTSLTYVPADNPMGADSTLTVRVGDVMWEEMPNLYAMDEACRGYATSSDDEGDVTIVFGDGKRGARLPTGTENVTATYRTGIGPEGEVAARSLTLLHNRPPGIRSVLNPLPATGAASPETLSKARRSARISTLTLGRIVSLYDFENFVLSFAGVAKAQAVLVKVKEKRVVHITIAVSDGSVVDPESALIRNMASAIDESRHPFGSVRLRNFSLQTFSLKACLIMDPRYIPRKVLDQVKTVLMHRFSFENRDFGQDVTASEVIATIQAVEGVVAVDLDDLRIDPPGSIDKVPKAPDLSEVKLKSRTDRLSPSRHTPAEVKPQPLCESDLKNKILGAKLARLEDIDKDIIQPAELLLLNPNGIELSVRA